MFPSGHFSTKLVYLFIYLFISFSWLLLVMDSNKEPKLEIELRKTIPWEDYSIWRFQLGLWFSTPFLISWSERQIIGNEFEDKFHMTISCGIVIFYTVMKTDWASNPKMCVSFFLLLHLFSGFPSSAHASVRSE
jgi:hypothetical protein